MVFLQIQYKNWDTLGNTGGYFHRSFGKLLQESYWSVLDHMAILDSNIKKEDIINHDFLISIKWSCE